MSTKKLADTYCFFCVFFFSVRIPHHRPPPPPKKKTKKKQKKKQKNKEKIFSFGFFVKIHLQESSKLELYGLYFKSYSQIFCNVDCTTCFTLCRWLLFCILPLLTVWHTVLVSGFPPPPPPHPHPHFVFFSDMDSLSKFTY